MSVWIGLLAGWAVLLAALGVAARHMPYVRSGQAQWRSLLGQGGDRVRKWLPSDDVERRLQWAGRPLALQPGEFWAIRLLLSVGLGAFGLTVGVFAAIALLAAGFLLPGVWLQKQVEFRQGQMQRELLPLLDLWAAAVEAGLPPVIALNRVCERTGGMLAQEFAQSAREVMTGRPLAEALTALGERTGLAEIETMVRVLIQAERYGAPLTQILREMVTQMRAERRQKAQAVAGRAAVRMMVPMVLFIFGPFLVMLLAPALWHLKSALM